MNTLEEVNNNFLNKNKILFFLSCIFDYAEKINMDFKNTYIHLKKNNGIQYLIENYDIEHTLSKEDTLEALSNIVNKNGNII